jgi:hypothetical protein
MEKVKTQAWDGFEAASSPAPGDLPSTRIALSLADDFWSYASITEFFFWPCIYGPFSEQKYRQIARVIWWSIYLV